MKEFRFNCSITGEGYKTLGECDRHVFGGSNYSLESGLFSMLYHTGLIIVGFIIRSTYPEASVLSWLLIAYGTVRLFFAVWYRAFDNNMDSFMGDAETFCTIEMNEDGISFSEPYQHQMRKYKWDEVHCLLKKGRFMVIYFYDMGRVILPEEGIDKEVLDLINDKMSENEIAPITI